MRKERGENKYFYDESLYFKEEAIEPDYLDFKYEEDEDVCVGEFEEVVSDDGVNVGEFPEEDEAPCFPPKNIQTPKPQFAPVHKKSKFPRPTLFEDDVVHGNSDPGNGYGSSKGLGLHSNKSVAFAKKEADKVKRKESQLPMNKKPVFAGSDKENLKSHAKGANLHSNKNPQFANSHKKADNLPTNKKPAFARPTLVEGDSNKSHKKGDNLHSNKKPVFARPTLKKDTEVERKSLFPKPTLVEDPDYKCHPKGQSLHQNKKPQFAHASHKKGDNLAVNKKPQFAKPSLADEPNGSSKKAANLHTSKKPVFAKPELKEECDNGDASKPQGSPKVVVNSRHQTANGNVQNVNSLSDQLLRATVGPKKVNPPPGFNATGAPPPGFSKQPPPGFPATTTTADGWKSPMIVKGSEGQVVVPTLNPSASSFAFQNTNPMMGQNSRFDDNSFPSLAGSTLNGNNMFPPLGNTLNGNNDFPPLGSAVPGNRAVWGREKGKEGSLYNHQGNGHGNGGGHHQYNPQHGRW